MVSRRLGLMRATTSRFRVLVDEAALAVTSYTTLDLLLAA